MKRIASVADVAVVVGVVVGVVDVVGGVVVVVVVVLWSSSSLDPSPKRSDPQLDQHLQGYCPPGNLIPALE